MKDVLHLLEQQQLRPKKDQFIMSVVLGDDYLSPTISVINKEVINESTYCEACAKGCLFLSFVGIANDYNGRVAGNSIDTPAHIKLNEIFSAEQLALIEAAFEGTFYLDHPEAYEYTSSINTFYHASFKQESPAEQRLIIICKNIIDNDGEFILPKQGTKSNEEISLEVTELVEQYINN